MPIGVAISTAPAIAKKVPSNMGERLYKPAVGFQEESVKKRDSAIRLKIGKDSESRKTTIKSAIAPAIVAKVRKIIFKILDFPLNLYQ
jgi:hypothetical protein